MVQAKTAQSESLSCAKFVFSNAFGYSAFTRKIRVSQSCKLHASINVLAFPRHGQGEANSFTKNVVKPFSPRLGGGCVLAQRGSMSVPCTGVGIVADFVWFFSGTSAL